MQLILYAIGFFLANIFTVVFTYDKIDIRKHMASNTVYQFTHNQPEQSYPQNCELEKLLFVVRHGTRFPERSDIEHFNTLEKVFQNASSKHEFKNRFQLSKNTLLSPLGEKEQYLLGKRSFKKYNKFWEKLLPYDPNIIPFRSTQFPRTVMSGISYSLGLFDGQGILESQPVYIFTVKPAEDFDLAMHQSCLFWNDTVANNNKVFDKQRSQFESTKLSKISDRISKEYNIQLEPIHTDYIYAACAYDLIFFENESFSWCNLLTQEDILTLEYFNDIKSYYTISYGNDLNKRIACNFFSNFVKEVDDYLNENSTVKANLMFAHRETVIFIYTALGLFEDSKPLTADATLDEISNRKFKTSKISPFSANIYFEIYTCKSKEEHILIQMVVNEKPVVIPGCNGSKYCEWNKFKKLLNDNLGCDYKEMCHIKK